MKKLIVGAGMVWLMANSLLVCAQEADGDVAERAIEIESEADAEHEFEVTKEIDEENDTETIRGIEVFEDVLYSEDCEETLMCEVEISYTEEVVGELMEEDDEVFEEEELEEEEDILLDEADEKDEDDLSTEDEVLIEDEILSDEEVENE